jgi:hypothetical protein
LVFWDNAGLAAGLLGIILNTALLAAFEEDNLILGITIGWPGNIIVVLAGYIAGRLHNEFIKRERMMYEFRSRERYLTLLKITISDILSPKTPMTRRLSAYARIVDLHTKRLTINEEVISLPPHFVRLPVRTGA